MKIVWICNFSNLMVREKLYLSDSVCEKIIRKVLRRKRSWHDYGAWISNGIKEFEKFEHVELHIISPHYGMRHTLEEFNLNGIYYHFFAPSDNLLGKKMAEILRGRNRANQENRTTIKNIIEHITPDIIHLYGAENPRYSMAALDIDMDRYPLLVTLQTLMSIDGFRLNYPITSKEYFFRSKIERQILERVKYIGAPTDEYKNFIWKNINKDAYITHGFLALGEKIEIAPLKKEYDFVYFAAGIEKAVDVAIEAFAIVCNKYPQLNMNIIGGASQTFLDRLNNRLNELGIKQNIHFSGKLPTHNDVLLQIQKSKFAVLPLKVDSISGTVREAMAAGIPVVSTITSGTPYLNKSRESILISNLGDHKSMANNMLILIEDVERAMSIRENAKITVNELWNNTTIMLKMVEAYKAIINHHKYNIPLSPEIAVKKFV